MKKVFNFFLKASILLLIYIVIIRFINPPITIFQINGILFAQRSSEFEFRRDYISWDEMGDNIKLAVISGEDQNFLTHNGFDWHSIQSSLSTKHNGTAASTISQQMVKNAFFWQGIGIFKYIRKILEFPVTFIVETIYSKQRILEIYLNISEMGPGIYGIEAASQYYFHKPAKNLTKLESAKIVACLPNPKKFFANESNFKTNKRAKWIIKQMNNIKTEPEIETFLEN